MLRVFEDKYVGRLRRSDAVVVHGRVDVRVGLSARSVVLVGAMLRAVGEALVEESYEEVSICELRCIEARGECEPLLSLVQPMLRRPATISFRIAWSSDELRGQRRTLRT